VNKSLGRICRLPRVRRCPIETSDFGLTALLPPHRKSKCLNDIYSARKRSEIMSRVRGRGNKKTELRLRELFQTHKIRGWRRNSGLPGKPDFVFEDTKLAVFVDGCFWHGCSKHGTIPSNNRNFWKGKLTQNKVRDRTTNRSLRLRGWRVLRIWQHELTRRNERTLLRRVRAALARAAGIGAS